jgi:hypothetical protein
VKKEATIFYLAMAISINSLADIYQWVDDNGNVQYSDRQPKNQVFKKKTTPNTPPSIDPELEHYRQQIKINKLVRTREQALAKEKTTEAQKKALQKKRYCRNLTSRQHADNNTATFFTRHSDGSRTVWTGEQREQYTKTLTDNLNEYCL